MSDWRSNWKQPRPMRECEVCDGNGVVDLIGFGMVVCDVCIGRGMVDLSAEPNPCIELGQD